MGARARYTLRPLCPYVRAALCGFNLHHPPPHGALVARRRLPQSGAAKRPCLTLEWVRRLPLCTHTLRTTPSKQDTAGCHTATTQRPRRGGGGRPGQEAAGGARTPLHTHAVAAAAAHLLGEVKLRRQVQQRDLGVVVDGDVAHARQDDVLGCKGPQAGGRVCESKGISIGKRARGEDGSKRPWPGCWPPSGRCGPAAPAAAAYAMAGR